MNCWKSVNLNKQYGMRWINLISCFTSLITFIILYVPFSMLHQGNSVSDSGIFLFVLAIILLPTLHSLLHILPLIMINRKMKLIINRKRGLPIFTFYADARIKKYAYILSALTPTIVLTFPGIIASLLFPSIYVYFLLFTSINVGMSFLDFLSIKHIIKAPRQSFVEKDDQGFDILLKAN
ncbi:DUF3267 domain-containing protein [Ornithinibacillus sp. BX22]|uniref:DUF3267 domain-containing protein n=2 Tax=Ornithinibacillus TaxID=484508 RepID=A0A923RIB5_9BACI|nr:MULTISPECIES: DUF3267 domain-containing protein [Ornithinibacillus]MBC5636623.1 DUF3267 domain-containing protein [Ornithinibacillus hominis]MBS3680535.1 DUF3267 domain-containing protein [Ornithinibacillus massiliensis]